MPIKPSYLKLVAVYSQRTVFSKSIKYLEIFLTLLQEEKKSLLQFKDETESNRSATALSVNAQ